VGIPDILLPECGSVRILGYPEVTRILKFNRDVLLRRRQPRRSDWSAGFAPAFAPGTTMLSVMVGLSSIRQ